MRVYAITLAFSNPDVLAPSLEQFYRTHALQDIQHIVVDQHYPIDQPEVYASLHRMARAYSFRLLDPGKNLGLHVGFNWAVNQIMDLRDEDIIIGYDGDSFPLTHGWDKEMASVMAEMPGIVWLTLGNPRTLADSVKVGYDEVTDERRVVRLIKAPITNSICAMRAGWLRRVGGLHEPMPFYGHLEAAMWDRMAPGERWGVLPQFTESDELRPLHDRAYIAYKWHHSHTQTWPGDFASYLAAGCPGMDGSPDKLP